MHAPNPDNTPPGEPGGRRYAVMGVELMTPTGSIKGKVRVDTGPLRLSELVTTAHELTGVLAARAHKREAMEGKQITCRAGCASCCRQMVPMSPPEAFYLMDMIDNLDPVRKAFVMGRFESVVSKCEEENMIQPMLDIILGGDDPHRTLNKKYFVLQLACPFLVDEKCSIHDDRPIACREYNVTSPALWCTDPFGYGVEKVPMPVPLSAPLSWVTAALTGEPPALIPLPLVPRWVAEHQELRERTWPGLELFKKFMDVAAGGDATAGGSGGSDAAGGGEATRSTP